MSPWYRLQQSSCLPNSFVAGTLVESIDGLVPIETLTEGDLVWAVDPETGNAGWYPITWTTSHEDADLVTLSVTLLGAVDEALSSTQEHTVMVTITATLEHPFWVEGIGWIDAGDLEAGDVLLSADGRRLVVQAAVRSAGPAMVYNFTVDALHTYTVTELRVVVHNQDCNFIEKALDAGLPQRNGKGSTSGYLFNSSNNMVLDDLIVSGNTVSLPPALQNMVRDPGGRLPQQGMPEFLHHVESKVARYMQDNNLSNATLVLNNHPCTGPLSCSQWLESILPQGATLRIIVPDGFDTRGPFDQVFKGI